MSTSARPAACGPTSTRPSSRGSRTRMSARFNDRLASIPGYTPGVPKGQTAEDVAGSDLAQLASNESPHPPLPQIVDAIAEAAASMNRYPDPDATRLQGPAGRAATMSNRIASRSRTAPARSCWPPVKRCSSPEPASSTRGRPFRCTRTWPRWPGPTRSGCHWPRARSTTSRRCWRRSPRRRAWSWSATRTTRPGPTCRYPR